MRMIPFLVCIGMLVYTAWTKDWQDLAFTACLILLVGFDSIVSVLRNER